MEVNKKESFNTSAIRREFRLAPSTQIKYLSDLRRYGLLKILGGNRYRGFEYQLTEFDDYHLINKQIDNVFDSLLEKLVIK